MTGKPRGISLVVTAVCEIPYTVDARGLSERITESRLAIETLFLQHIFYPEQEQRENVKVEYTSDHKETARRREELATSACKRRATDRCVVPHACATEAQPWQSCVIQP